MQMMRTTLMLVLVLTSCGDRLKLVMFDERSKSEFEKFGSADGSAVQSVDGPPRSTGSDIEGDTDKNGNTALEPGVIAGAFLMCARQPAASSPSDEILHCGLVDQGGAPLKVPDDLRIETAYLNAGDQEIALNFMAGLDADWPWFTAVDRLQLSTAQGLVVHFVDASDRKRSMVLALSEIKIVDTSIPAAVEP